VKVAYKKLFLKDLARLKGTEVYDQIKEIAFEILPNCEDLSQASGIRPLRNAKDAFRIRVGEYRIGLKKRGDAIELVRVLHRKDIYRFFP
jgi:mRNA interferase RelE/StbE